MMALQDLIDLNTAAFAQHGKSGELPSKYMTTVGAGLEASLVSHSPAHQRRQYRSLEWALTDSGAKAVWRTLV